MIFTRFYDDGLAQASYLVGCTATGEALIVDPNRDLEQYLRGAAAHGLKISAVTETHIHADFVSGSRELAERTGARLYLSAEGGKDWQYQFAEASGAQLLRDGSVIQVGNVRIDVRHTPGHTPEHLSFLVTDGATATDPMGAITGDFLFVGDVGRPDLLEKAVKVSGSAATAAATMFESVQKFKTLPDYLQIWPGHGAGSACGKGMSAVPQSSLGYEKRFNWALTETDEKRFIHAILAGQPEPPRYFAEMKRMNRAGPRSLKGFRMPPLLPPERLPSMLSEGAIVVDIRPAPVFAAGHVPGAISIPLNRSFVTWAGWLIPYTHDFVLLAQKRDDGSVARAVRELAMIGLDRVVGVFDGKAIEQWSAAGKPLITVPELLVDDLAARRPRPVVIDVRGESEWEAGHMDGAQHIPLGYLLERMDEVPRDRPVVLHCQGGSRSHIAASLLQAQGYTNVTNLTGGFGAWEAAGLPVQRGE
ncbi:MAG TPA: rhodanese-like domain-containing protein [Gemmatimonadales bacterium]|jgi:hydroxyacylglutathione hydrolase|nr:rhodanese-like domain-containing protein [Gemmatimonadales bacterium]